MDIAATALFAQQQAASQLQAGVTMMKSAAKSEQKTAAILAQAVEGAAANSGSRGTKLDISV